MKTDKTYLPDKVLYVEWSHTTYGELEVVPSLAYVADLLRLIIVNDNVTTLYENRMDTKKTHPCDPSESSIYKRLDTCADDVKVIKSNDKCYIIPYDNHSHTNNTNPNIFTLLYQEDSHTISLFKPVSDRVLIENVVSLETNESYTRKWKLFRETKHNNICDTWISWSNKPRTE